MNSKKTYGPSRAAIEIVKNAINDFNNKIPPQNRKGLEDCVILDLSKTILKIYEIQEHKGAVSRRLKALPQQFWKYFWIILGKDVEIQYANCRGMEMKFPFAAISEATFINDADFSFINFCKGVDFSGACFNECVKFIGSNFGFDTCFKNTVFEKSVSFEDTQFDKVAQFTGSRFGDNSSFRRTVFRDYVTFEKAMA